jgi:hypothetical protein
MADQPQPIQSLEYQTPPRDEPASDRPSPFVASLLAVPALSCWVILLGLVTHLFHLSLRDAQVAGMILLWCLAVFTAIGSFVLDLPRRSRPRPWYVWFNLVINGLGLLFTVGVIVLAVINTH